MNRPDDATAAINAYLAQHETKSLLRFLTCGSVDDGKSTLLGRLLYDTKLLFDDQLTTLHGDSQRHGGDGGFQHVSHYFSPHWVLWLERLQWRP